MEEPCCIPGTGAPGCPKGKKSIMTLDELDPTEWPVSEGMVALSGAGAELRALSDASSVGRVVGGRRGSCRKSSRVSASCWSAKSSSPFIAPLSSVTENQ